MKVILLKDVAKIGRRFEVVSVADGLALNKLIPQNLAQSATPENLKRLQNLSSKVEHDRAQAQEHFKEVLAACSGKELEIVVEANSEGRMFQALKPLAIAEAIEKHTGHPMSVEHIVMKTPIKSVGEHTIDLHSGSDHDSIELMVVAKGK